METYGVLGELSEFLEDKGVVGLLSVLIGAPLLELVVEEGWIVAFLDQHCVLVVQEEVEDALGPVTKDGLRSFACPTGCPGLRA